MNNARVRGALTTLKRNKCFLDNILALQDNNAQLTVIVPSELLMPKKRIKIKEFKNSKK